METRRLASSICLLVLIGCAEPGGDSVDELVLPARSDATTGGTPGFYFLPRLAPPTTFPGVFDSVRRPDVIVEEVDPVTGETGPEVVRFERIHVSPMIDAYVAAFSTADRFVAGQAYRITVMLSGTELGFADVAAVARAADKPTVPEGFVAVVVGANLKVAFRLEVGVADRDADGFPDGEDNCPDDANPDQADGDEDGFGDVCDCLSPEGPGCPPLTCDGDPCGVSDVCANRDCIEEGGGVTCVEERFRLPISFRASAPGGGSGGALFTPECGEFAPASSGPCEGTPLALRYRCPLNDDGMFRIQVEGTAPGCTRGRGPLVPYEPGQCSFFNPGPNTVARCCAGNLFPN
jgi:hypothetical protein